MTELRTIISCLVVLLLIIAPMTSARAQQQMIPAMADELTQYPGSTVELSTEKPGGDMITILNCGKTPVEEVSRYYKTKLKEKGYQINVFADYPNFVGIKDGRWVHFNLQSENGDTVISLEITNK